MMSNPSIELILHGDDAGMCHSANEGVIQGFERGVLSSSSIMMPCPWAKEICLYAAQNPDKDFGVHVTLTSEWATYRWRPVAPVTEVPSLVDEEGFLWQNEALVAQHAQVEDVEKELRAQIQRARQWGVQPKHMDSHMGALFVRPEYLITFYRVAMEEGIPPLAANLSDEQIRQINPEIQSLSREPLAVLASMGYPVLESFNPMPHGSLEEKRSWLLNLASSFKPGVHEVILHPAALSNELRAICATAEDRDRERGLMVYPGLGQEIQKRGIQLTNWPKAKAQCKPA